MKIFSYPILESSTEGYNIRGGEQFRFLEFWAITNTGVAEAVYSMRPTEKNMTTYYDANMNLYKKVNLEEGRRDFRTFTRKLEISRKSIATARLTYATDFVRKVDYPREVDLYDEMEAPHADALITDNPDVTLFLYAADCAIIYLVDTRKRAIGLIHASWRTALKGLIGDTVRAMSLSYGTSPKNLVAVIAPCLGEEAFEVGEEVAERFEMAEMGDLISRAPHEKPRLDFYSICEEYLKRAGVFSEDIYSMNEFCTYRDDDKFHSFRRGPVLTAEDGMTKHMNGLNGAFLSLT